jgi:nucleotide-binding universal stress UspA family protein
VSYRIVVGVDGSENSTRALNWAVDEARVRDADVTALFAWEFPLIGIPGAFEREQLEQQAKALISHHVAAVAGNDGEVRVEAVIANGDPATSLIAACEHADADLLVLGARTRNGGGITRVLIDSVAQQCVAEAPCPVLIVKDKPATDD